MRRRLRGCWLAVIWLLWLLRLRVVAGAVRVLCGVQVALRREFGRMSGIVRGRIVRGAGGVVVLLAGVMLRI